MKNFNTILEKIYNTLGNKYLTDNFDTEPFEFKVIEMMIYRIIL